MTTEGVQAQEGQEGYPAYTRGEIFSEDQENVRPKEELLRAQGKEISEILYAPPVVEERLAHTGEGGVEAGSLYARFRAHIERLTKETLRLARAGVAAGVVLASPAVAEESPTPPDDTLVASEIRPEDQVFTAEEVEEGVAFMESALRTMREDQRERVLFEARMEQGFKSRDELLAYFVELARTKHAEYAALYGVRDDEKVSLGSYYTSGRSRMVIPPDAQSFSLAPSRFGNVPEVRYLHTHPEHTIEDVARNEGMFDDKFPQPDVPPPHDSEHRWRSLPFSSPDINTAILTTIRNQLEGMNQSTDGVLFERSFVSEVVDPSGTWELSVDLSHPYMKSQREACESYALGTKEAQNLMSQYQITREELGDILRGVTSPDEFVGARSRNRKEVRNMDFIHVWAAYMTSGVIGPTGETEFTELQLEFLRHDADTDQEVIDRYIAALAERGLHVTYTPHSRPAPDTPTPPIGGKQDE
jgi:hypothetical protein